MTTLRFTPIDLARHAADCVAMRRDGFVVSFGDCSRFESESGHDGAGYLRWLQAHQSRYPQGLLHAWDGEQLAGQVEVTRPEGADHLYVNLFYLQPAYRHRGIGAQLHARVLALLDGDERQSLRLCAANANAAALRFYRKHGWQDDGVRANAPDSHYWRWPAS